MRQRLAQGLFAIIAMSDLTPLMKQYQEIKVQYPGTILFFRMGDFYEMFGDDAVTAAGILQIALTTRDKGRENPVPMCGVPYHAAEGYLAKLIQAGRRVAVCEQVEDPKLAKGLVRRDVVRVVTPGTHMPETLPSEPGNRFVLCLYPRDNLTGFAYADISTGEFVVQETAGAWEDELTRLDPSEILVPASLLRDSARVGRLEGFAVTPLEDSRFEYSLSVSRILEHFGWKSLGGSGLEGMLIATSAAGALMNYLAETQKSDLAHIRSLRPVGKNRHMVLDAITQRNLELVRSQEGEALGATLFGVLNDTRTSMGGRLLKKWLLQPLLEPTAINDRHESVATLKEDPSTLASLREDLNDVPDLERLISRLSLGLGNARDLVALKSGLQTIPRLKDQASGSMNPSIRQLAGRMPELGELVDLIENTITEEPPLSVRDGGLIRGGFSGELDELRNLSGHSREYLAALEVRERQATGISTLKVGYNRVFGYFIEVPKARQNLVPAHFIRKQTLVGAERYITDELKTYEDRILGAEDKIKAIEYAIFCDIRDTVAAAVGKVQETAGAVAELDALCGLAQVARVRRYVRPAVNEGDRILITGGRHPVVEAMSASERFTPNDTELDGGQNRLLVITGPNMAGKSTYMRQVALITLMAQMGSFVPADQAEIGVADRIFTRIGASDRLSRGQSTFMVEMTETANILSNATVRSLILLDEVGRGTSTFDGISIAWAVAERIAQQLRARTLFATHYHELTELEMVMEGVKNYNIAVKEWGDEIIFLRKIREGAADKSYGIQVGRLAGLPAAVIERAKEVLANLEKAELNEVGSPKLAYRADEPLLPLQQLDLFTTQPDPVVVDLLGMDITRMTPIEALNKLHELQKLAGDSEGSRD